jgi:predicted amidohydrolase
MNRNAADLHPKSRPGLFMPGLWEHDVAELFIAHPGGRYFEFNLSPNAAWWSCEFKAPRVREEETDIVFPEVATFAELAPDGGLHNSAAFVDPAGDVLAVHRKAHLFGDLDRAYFSAGDAAVPVVDHEGVGVAMMICYDVEFPEYARTAALAGAHLIAVPTAQMEPFEFVADTVVRARAWENQVYVAYANHDGVEGSTTYVGRSSIVGPDGSVLDRLESGTGLVWADVEPEKVREGQRANPYLTDLRPALYPGA